MHVSHNLSYRSCWSANNYLPLLQNQCTESPKFNSFLITDKITRKPGLRYGSRQLNDTRAAWTWKTPGQHGAEWHQLSNLIFMTHWDYDLQLCFRFVYLSFQLRITTKILISGYDIELCDLFIPTYRTRSRLSFLSDEFLLFTGPDHSP